MEKILSLILHARNAGFFPYVWEDARTGESGIIMKKPLSIFVRISKKDFPIIWKEGSHLLFTAKNNPYELNRRFTINRYKPL